MKNVRVASVQLQAVAGDKRANLDTIRTFVEQAAAERAEIVAFPECSITGYWFLRRLTRAQLAELAEPIPEGPSTRALLALAKRQALSIGAGLIEVADDGRLYNSYVVAMPDGRCQWHRKLHAFVNEHLSCGDRFTVFDTPHGCRLGVLICYDNNLVENVRITALAGAEILLAPHQTGGCNSPSPHGMKPIDRSLWDARHSDPAAIDKAFRGPNGRGWLMRWLPSRAHDNGLFVVFSNGVGPDDDEIRTGGAMILDPYGRILTETCATADTMVVADLDASLRERSTGARWLRARRPELYAPLSRPTGNERDTRSVRFDLE